MIRRNAPLPLVLLLLLLSCGEAPTAPEGPAPLVVDPDAPWRGHRAAFTFSTDDNFVDNIAWADVFRARGQRFTVFTVSTWVGLPGKLTVADLRTLDADGFEIGGHSATHPHMPQLDDLSLAEELRSCRDSLESWLGPGHYRCLTFAYPYHEHDARVMAAAEQVYLGARDGGLSSDGWPRFSQGKAVWGDVALYEIPLATTTTRLVNGNLATEEETRTAVRAAIAQWKASHTWANLYAHRLADIDEAHLGWVLDEILADGDVWVAPFGDVVAYVRTATAPAGRRAHSVDVESLP